MSGSFPAAKRHVSRIIYVAVLLTAGSLVASVVLSEYLSMQPPRLVTFSENPQYGSLKFVASVNSTTETPGNPFNVTILETNIANSSLKVQDVTDYALSAFTNLTDCPLDQKGGLLLAVFPGHYDPKNITDAQPLRVFPGPGANCPPRFDYYLFSPNSEQVWGYENSFFGPEPYVQFNMSMTMDVQGYYPQIYAPLTPFPSGSYTLVAGDEWGSTAYLYLRVI
jgi:hypothetical protein